MLNALGILAAATFYTGFVIGLHAIGIHGPPLSILAVAGLVGMLYALGATRS